MKFITANIKINLSVFMRNIFIVIGIALIFLLSNCGDDDDRLSSNYIILNRVSNRANISHYNGKTKTLTKQFYTTDNISYFSGAAKKDDFLYTMIFEGYPKLRKIDLKTGTQVKSVDVWDVWMNFKTFINFSNNNVIISHIEHDGYRIKVYDENLKLTDSTTRKNIVQLDGATISNNQLFSVVGNGNKGYILVMDLNTLTPVDSLELSSQTHLFLPYREGKLLGLKSNGYFVLNTESLEIEESKEAYLDTYYGVALNSLENVLYYVSVLPQPSLYTYILRKLDLSTGESSPVTKYGEPVNGPIIYDDKTKVIVSGGGLKIFSGDGEVLDLIEEAPPGTWKIFVHH